MAEKKTTAPAESGKANAGDDDARTPDQIEAEIEEAREDLGDTVGKLADKADVKKQARLKVDETKERAQEKVGAVADSAKQTFESAPESASQAANRMLDSARENPQIVIGAAIGLLLAVFLLRRRK